MFLVFTLLLFLLPLVQGTSPVYVSTTGQDVSTCGGQLAPCMTLEYSMTLNPSVLYLHNEDVEYVTSSSIRLSNLTVIGLAKSQSALPSIRCDPNGDHKIFDMDIGGYLSLHGVHLNGTHCLTGVGLRDNSTLVVSNCSFAKGFADSVIESSGSSDITHVTIQNSVFTELNSDQVIDLPGGISTISFCTFIRNTMPLGIIIQVGSLTVPQGTAMRIYDCTFVNNDVHFIIRVPPARLDLLLIARSSFDANNMTLSFPGISGGVVSASAGATLNNLTIVDSCFRHNSCDNGGCALHVSIAAVTVRNCRFSENVARDGDAAVFQMDVTGSLLVFDSVFEGNYVEGPSSDGGVGKLRARMGGLVAAFTNCVFHDNRGVRRAGVIYANTQTNGTISGDTRISFVKCYMTGNSALDGSVVFFNNYGALGFTNTVLTNNVGGYAIRIEPPNSFIPAENLTVILDNSFVVNNTGGGLSLAELLGYYALVDVFKDATFSCNGPADLQCEGGTHGSRFAAAITANFSTSCDPGCLLDGVPCVSFLPPTCTDFTPPNLSPPQPPFCPEPVNEIQSGTVFGTNVTLDGNQLILGTVTFGPSASVAVSGSLGLSSAAVIQLTDPIAGQPSFVAQSEVVLDGLLQVTISSRPPQVTQTFTVFSGSSVSGAFSNISVSGSGWLLSCEQLGVSKSDQSTATAFLIDVVVISSCSTGLSVPVIAGISAGAVVVATGAIVLMVFLMRRKRDKWTADMNAELRGNEISHIKSDLNDT